MSQFNGCVQLIDGDFYFSPNSRRTVNLPLIYDDFPSHDSFSNDFAEFRQPHWWQPACPYLAFIPLRPVFAGVPFQDLFHLSYFHCLHYGPFGLDPQIILGWVRLEKNIMLGLQTIQRYCRQSLVKALQVLVQMSLQECQLFRLVLS